MEKEYYIKQYEDVIKRFERQLIKSNSSFNTGYLKGSIETYEHVIYDLKHLK